MTILKLEPGEYKVIKDGEEYLVSKDSYVGGWSVSSNGKYLTYKNTRKECLEFIEKGQNVKILDFISMVPPVKLDSKFIQKDSPNIIWKVSDIVYSTRDGKWKIKGYYRNDSMDEGRNTWDYDDFGEECEELED